MTGPAGAVSDAGAGERDRRRALGVPDDAARVLVFTESSHWDPNWLLTSEGYFGLRVRRTLRQAVVQLLDDPRRVYSVECVFFLRMFWERVPELRPVLRQLVNEGRLRMMGSGVTTPDTIVPSTELLIRDYLLGQEWLRDNAMTVEPDVAYFPDTFGFSPGLPEVLNAVGVRAAAVCRIDGMYFFGNETEPAGRFPRPGSSADRLTNEERTTDFVWRGPDGAEILCHWLAFTYGQGDMLAHAGVTREVGVPLAVPWRTDHHVARMVDGYTAKLGPLARTPYQLCPIGFDFSAPIPRLGELLERYNQRHYPTTGTWVLNAGLDDYLSLVDWHRGELPVLDLDPSQYYTGFFTSRPTLKRRYFQLCDTLLVAERLALAPGAPAGAAQAARTKLTGAWWTAATANHHDYVTGTAPDRVVRREQLPWLDDALGTARRVLAEVAGPSAPGPEPARPAPVAPGARGGPTRWRRLGPLVEVVTASLTVVFDAAAGGAVASVSTPGGATVLGPSLDLVAYEDSGGLWRMGHEFAGGRFRPLDRAGLHPVDLDVAELDDGGIEVVADGRLDGRPFRRRVIVDPAEAVLRVDLETTLSDRRTVTTTVTLPTPAGRLVTDVPGGVVTRPARRRFDPTFWAVQTFAHVPGPDPGGPGEGAGGTAIFLGMPGALALRPAGGPGGRGLVEVVAARNAWGETAYGFLPLPAQPARGHDPGPHPFAMAVAPTGGEDWRAADLVTRGVEEARRGRLTGPERRLARAADAVVTTDHDQVRVLAATGRAVAPGMVARLSSVAPSAVTVRVAWPGVPLAAAARCDGRERDLRAVAVDGEAATLTVDPGLTSVRLVAAG